MEFPFGHSHHHHRPRHDGEEDQQSYGPPPPRNNLSDAPPRHGLYQPHPHFDPYAPPPREPVPYGSEPYIEAPSSPPPFGQMSHLGHQTGITHVSHHSSYQPDMPSGFDHQIDENLVSDNLAGLAGRSTMKVFSKADPNYYLTIRDGKVILAPSDPSDESQHWYKDEKYSTRVKDSEGSPCFALVNKATGEAMKHSVGASHPVHLTRYDPDKLDESVLWTESKDFGDGYRTIRMVNNVKLNVDAYHGDIKSGGVCDGTSIVLWDWNKGDNQLWKIFPFCKFCLIKLFLLRFIEIAFLEIKLLLVLSSFF